MQEVKTLSAIDLKGSVEIIADYFNVAINNILYNRAIYPESSFKRVKKFGRSVLIATDEELIKYLDKLIDQLKVWLMADSLKRLVIVIKSVKSGAILERWQFNIKREEDDIAVEDIDEGLGAIVRQIVASSSFLPNIKETCTFDLLVYTNRNCEIPEGWDESGPCFVPNSAQVQLRSFSTKIHQVESIVSYRQK
ncbi:unnamed protein product [Hymenolepis diminuta]|uniref:HORMA domain-containing protein n=1 Tax=Hymenolepis diminuta TaxID=6216 RepID=A0A564Y7M7_HYMDI|nr:unnamed protein product [Hymenolepis diminuta]